MDDTSKRLGDGPSRREGPLATVVLATPEAGASGTFIILDVLSSVGRLWEALHGEAFKPPVFAPRLLSVDGVPYRNPNGLLVTPHGALADEPAPDIVIIPELQLGLSGELPESYAPIVDWLKAAHAGGAILCAACSGTVLLAATGLLDGEDAATHWGYCTVMSRLYPRVRVRKERILVPAGTGHRLVTSGAAASWDDLLLYLVARFAGQEQARRIAKVFLLNSHPHGQLPYASLAAVPHQDEAVAQSQAWIADNYKAGNPVAAMAACGQLSERAFLKRFRRATGLSPIEYVQVLRIEEAKHLIEATDMPLDDIAAEVGYAEPSSFRRLFRRMVGLTPSAYRRQRLPALAAIEG